MIAVLLRSRRRAVSGDYSIASLSTLYGHALIARTDYRDTGQRFIYKWDAHHEEWIMVAPYALGEGPMVGVENRLYAYGKASADSVPGMYCLQDRA